MKNKDELITSLYVFDIAFVKQRDTIASYVSPAAKKIPGLIEFCSCLYE